MHNVSPEIRIIQSEPLVNTTMSVSKRVIPGMFSFPL